MKQRDIMVLGYWTQEDVADGAVVERFFDTIKEAKEYAKRILTPEWAEVGEMSAPCGYSMVMVDGGCLYDFFRKA